VFLAMAVLWPIILLFIIPIILFIVYLAVSSCLGDSIRSRISNLSDLDPRRGAYDRRYARMMGTSGFGASEQIELQDMLESRADGYD